MDLYAPSPQSDVKLFELYRALIDSGDIHSYPESYLSLSGFLAALQAPTVVVLQHDDDGVWFALWYTPQPLPFVTVNLWVREAKRHTMTALKAVDQALAVLFSEHHTLIAYCAEPRVIQLYEHYGMGRHMPDIYVGDTSITLLSLTREQFHQILRKRAA